MDKGIFHTWWIRLSKRQYLLQCYCNLYENNNETILRIHLASFLMLFEIKSVVHFYHAGIVMRSEAVLLGKRMRVSLHSIGALRNVL